MWIGSLTSDGAYQGVTLVGERAQAALSPPNDQTWVNWHVLFTHARGRVRSPLARKRRRVADFYPGHPAGRDRRPADRRENLASTFGEKERLRHRQGGAPASSLPRGRTTYTRPRKGCRRGRRRRARRRALSPWYFKGPETCCSPAISRADSRICSAVPFRSGCGTDRLLPGLGPDPQMVISEGRSFWMQAYTTRRYSPTHRTFRWSSMTSAMRQKTSSTAPTGR